LNYYKGAFNSFQFWVCEFVTCKTTTKKWSSEYMLLDLEKPILWQVSYKHLYFCASQESKDICHLISMFSLKTISNLMLQSCEMLIPWAINEWQYIHCNSLSIFWFSNLHHLLAAIWHAHHIICQKSIQPLCKLHLTTCTTWVRF
jgi:hypothetical protein